MKIIPKTPWLSPEEQEEVIKKLLGWGIIKFSNERNFPLKSGGRTDIYVSIRDCRNTPGATTLMASLYGTIPLARLKPDRFVEVPEAVSGIAGHLSATSGIPYITIREQSKEGRVSDAKIIGTPILGETVVIIDDVITDGASKLVPWLECKKRGLDCETIVVLVDRQQGWKKKFLELGIEANVWAGMTLHDIRRYLIKSGIMQRCSPENEEKNPIILALDDITWEEALELIDPLRTTGCILKVNDMVFAEGFDHLLPNLSVYGRVMVDIKAHDITKTVMNIMKRLRKHEPWAVTMHASAGEEKISEAVKIFQGTETKVLAITLLTDIKEECLKIYGKTPSEQVLAMATLAYKAGAHGVVCSAEEVGMLKKLFPEMTLVVPGVRSPGKSAGGQKRIGTPAQAIKDGANHVVMGSQILKDSNPLKEMERVLTKELEIPNLI